MKSGYPTLLLLLITLTLLSSCMKKKLQIHRESDIAGLASPVRLNTDITLVYLADYFADPSVIDSFTVHPALQQRLSKDKKELTLNAGDGLLPALSALKVWRDGMAYSIPVRKSEKLKTTLIFNPSSDKPADVRFAGEMNGWNPAVTPFKEKDGVFYLELLLNPGNYQYQIVADGKWMLDPANPDSVSNNLGGFNSLLKVGGNEKNKPLLLTKSHSGNRITLEAGGETEDIFVFWQNYLLPSGFITRKGNEFVVNIPSAAEDVKRSFIRAWAMKDDGISNDILIPLERGEPVSDPAVLQRDDWEAAVLYFLMVDRFHNGNPSNDKRVDDPEILPKVNYFGGDIAGVTAKLRDGFFEELGISTIWLSPIAQNPTGAYGLWPDPKTKFSGYHGYWPVSSSKVDFRFGTGNEFEELIAEAHNRGINVILDYVANHVHQEHPVYQNHPDWATDLYLPDGSLNTERWDEYRLTTWFDTFLPTLDLSRPDVVEVMTDSAMFWLRTYGLDGFRHDATKHIPEIFWRTLTGKIRNEVVIPQGKRVYQIGETYGSHELIGSYVSSGMLDAQFDFNTYDRAVSVFVNDAESFTSLSESLHEALHQYGYHNLMGYMTGNQDRARFISYAGGSLSFAENAKMAGWKRDVGAGDPVGYKKLRSMMAFIHTIPGVPTIYYGDEFGMPGANDPDNRRMMKFTGLSEEEMQTNDVAKRLIRLRRSNLALVYGDFIELVANEKVWVYSRIYFDQIAIVAFNKSDKAHMIDFAVPQGFKNHSLNAVFGNEFNRKGEAIAITLPPNSFEILTR
ncbi:MAG: alpha-glucosidase C-terminal domain-containing protein [Bacteroidales bacterium]|nr:alpha-glucosidase C-terminal domain-containing protein [Bacteroidales bacterium]